MTTFRQSFIRFIFFLMSIQLIHLGSALPLILMKAAPISQMLSDEDNSAEETESQSFSKVVDQETIAHFDFTIFNLTLVKFIHFNSKYKVLFHPEFTTPPPKYLLT